MELKPEHITIAVTVYNRRDYVLDAIHSSLAQTVPVKVIVVEDCGPDAGLRKFVTREFGNRIQYFRNPKNRGLFDNWNACIECCPTPWLSILHDDDRLPPGFAATMLTLAQTAPGQVFYRGQSAVLREDGTTRPPPAPGWRENWQAIDLIEMGDQHFIMMFAGNLFSVASARAVGGARTNSNHTGDWYLWFRLALHGDAAQTATEVAVARSHEGAGRGSTHVERMGWHWALENGNANAISPRCAARKTSQFPLTGATSGPPCGIALPGRRVVTKLEA